MSVRPVTFNPDGSIDRLSLDVTPGLPSDDLLNGSVGYTKLSAKAANGRSGRVQAQQLPHPRLIEFGAATQRSSRVTAFDYLVYDVVFCGAKK